MALIHLWIGLVGLVVMLYVALDGFSLGVAILFPSAKKETEKDILMNAIAPVWDANQTWIVFGGGALFAVFPRIYTILFSALYIPLLTFLFGLIFRGVALELRTDSVQKAFWNRAFFIGSVVATFAQGVTLGAYISGVKTVNGMFAGGAFDWLNPFSVMVGVALIAGYGLLGSTYLIMKTVGDIQIRAYRQAFWAALIVAAFMILVSIWTPILDSQIPARWFSQPRIYFVWIFPLLGVVFFILLIKSLTQRQSSEAQPFMFSLLLFLSAYLGLQTAIFPYAIPGSITIYEAAAQSQTMIFTLWGVAFVIPVVLGYIIYSYWIFRGKVHAQEGYH